jgi:cytoskeletal protein CcmA (bactofilin family)
MTVTINKTDGTVLTTIADGAVDTSSTNIALIGRLYRNYGELINENMVKLLENFASTSSPSTPIIGQIWYDKAAETIKVYRDTGFVPLARINSSSAEPSNPGTADLWYDLTDEQLKYYSGTAWIVISPGYTASQTKTGAFAESIQDTTTANHIAVVIRQQNQPIAIFSKDAEYTPLTAITGFTSVKKGLTLSNISDFILNGTAADAKLLDGLDSTDYMRATANTATTGTLTVSNDTGFYVGASASKINLSMASTTGKITKVGTGALQFIMNTDLAAEINDNEQFTFKDGSAATPTISFIDDTDTGIYRIGSGNIGIALNGVNAASISTSGFVIEGPTTINDTITVTGNAALQGNLAVTNTLTVNGNAVLGNAAADTITFNADTVDLPNDLTFTTGDVDFDGFLSANGGLDVTGAVTATGNSTFTGRVNITDNVIISGTISGPGDTFKIDSSARLLVNRASPPTGYTNAGDQSMGAANAIYARNVPKYVATFNGTLAGLAIYRSHHVATVTRSTTGTYAITLRDDLGTNIPTLSAYPTITGSVNGSGSVGYDSASISSGSTSITLYTYNSSGSLADFTRVSIAIWDGTA